jgi:hypothetical protein
MAESDPVFLDRIAASRHELQQLGWTDRRNVRIDVRSGSTNPERIRKDVAELIAIAPDVMLAAGSPTVGVMQQIFVGVVDPVGAGFVASLARPGGNINRLYFVRVRHQREMAGAAQAGRCPSNARGGSARPRQPGRHRAIGRDVGRCPVFRSGVDPGRRGSGPTSKRDRISGAQED